MANQARWWRELRARGFGVTKPRGTGREEANAPATSGDAAGARDKSAQWAGVVELGQALALEVLLDAASVLERVLVGPELTTAPARIET